MTIDQIRCFQEIVKTGSMTKAAKNLALSQPNISLTIKMLEKEFGIILFHRSSKGVEMTQQGAEFLYYAENIIENVNQVQKIKDAQPVEEQIFSISTQFVSYGFDPLSHLMSHTSNHKVTLINRQNTFFEVVDDVATGRSNLGLITLSEDQVSLLTSFLNKKGIAFTPLCHVEMKIAIRKNHPLTTLEHLTFEKIKDYPLAFFDITDKEYLSAQSLKRLEVNTFKQTFIVTDFLHLFHLLETQNAVAFLSSYNALDLNYTLKQHGLSIHTSPLPEPLKIQLGYIKLATKNLGYLGQQFIQELSTLIHSFDLE